VSTRQSLTLPLALSASELWTWLLAQAPELVSRTGHHLPALTTTTDRRYTPTDGATEPDCPFVDVVRVRGQRGAIDLAGDLEIACWNDCDISGWSVRLHVSAGKDGSAPSTWQVSAAKAGAGKADGLEVSGSADPFSTSLTDSLRASIAALATTLHTKSVNRR